jgi:hypothetical protein
MKIIQQISKCLQEIFLTKANKLSKETGFVKRISKMTGALFAQTLVFGWLSKPNSSLEELSQVAMSLGLKISAQGIEQRLNQEASDFLKILLEASVTKLISSDKVSTKVLNKFSCIYVLDSSIISLPEQLKDIYTGYGICKKSLFIILLKGYTVKIFQNKCFKAIKIFYLIYFGNTFKGDIFNNFIV